MAWLPNPYKLSILGGIWGAIKESECKIIREGDLNITLDPDLDCSGGNPLLKTRLKCVADTVMNYDLVDIWRIRNSNSKKFSVLETTKPKTPSLLSFLDDALFVEVARENFLKWRDEINLSDDFRGVQVGYAILVHGCGRHFCCKLNSPVPELSFLPAPYRGWTRAGERRVQDNLHAHAQNEPIKNY